MENKIDYLKRLNKQKNILRELEESLPYLHGKIVIIDSDQEKNIRSAIYNKLYNITGEEVEGNNRSEIIAKSIEIITENRSVLEKMDQPYLIEYSKKGHFSLENYMLKIESITILDNIEHFLNEIGFSSGLTDFMIVSENLEKGLYIERTEYSYFILRKWGI